MKFALLILLACSGLAAAAVLPIDLSQFRDATGDVSIVMISDNFEKKSSQWKLPSGCRIVPGAGMGGSAALLCERQEKDYKNYWGSIARLPLKLKAGSSYKMTIWYRTENLKPRLHMELSASIRHCRNGQEMHLDNPKRMAASSEWKKVAMTFVGSDYETELILRLFYETSGRVYWDNLEIVEISSNGMLYPITPLMLAPDANGRFIFRVVTSEPLNTGAVVLKTADKTAWAPVIDSRAMIEFGSLPEGKVGIDAFLVDTVQKTILIRNQFNFFNSKHGAPPEGAVSIDAAGRVMVDGKPFLPVGIYATWLRKEDDLKRIADGGFNFILHYTSRGAFDIQSSDITTESDDRWTSPDYGSSRWNAVARRSLDLIHKYGLKYMACHMRVYGEKDTEIKKFNPVFLHPALLAYYLADEISAASMPLVRRSRETIAGNDLYHPVIALTDKPQHCLYYGQAADVIGIDPYPIMDKGSDSILTVRDFLISANAVGLPVMYVPQAFNWGAHKPKENYSDFRYPTETEMRSMVLLGAIYGAKWFCFYSYTTIMERQEKFNPGSSRVFWPRVCAVAKLLRGLEPWLLSLEKAPDVAIASKASSIVDARAFSSDGKLRVLVTACGPGKAEAVITVPGKTNLKSRFGNIRPLGGGKYLFCGDDICSDILME